MSDLAAGGVGAPLLSGLSATSDDDSAGALAVRRDDLTTVGLIGRAVRAGSAALARRGGGRLADLNPAGGQQPEIVVQ